MKEFIITHNESGQRADKYLSRILPGASKSFLYKMIRKKNIDLNGHKLEGNEILQENDSLKVWFSDETFQKFSGACQATINTGEYSNAFNKLSDIKVTYEDENIIILDKPYGILSQKAQNDDISLNEWLIGYLLNTSKLSAFDLSYFKPSVQNRLDRNTTGLVLCAKTVKGASLLSSMIKERTIQKYYKALVYGSLKGEETLTGYHCKDNKQNKAKIISVEEYESMDISNRDDYSKVVTRYKATEGIKFEESEIDASVIEVELVTGKSHQIRAHMASIGYPLVNDRKYYGRKERIIKEIPHYLLHAYKVVFPICEELGKLSGKEIYSQTDITGNIEV